jgi:Ni/Fe-hydrogenase subunit HybB-like protein
MNDRYPYLRFVIDAAQVIAGAVAVIIFVGGTLRSCHVGGFPGFFAFLITIGIAAVAYVIVMVKLEVLRVLLDLERNTRQLPAAQHPDPASGPRMPA